MPGSCSCSKDRQDVCAEAEAKQSRHSSGLVEKEEAEYRDTALTGLAAEFERLAGVSYAWRSDGKSIEVTGSFTDDDLAKVTWVAGVADQGIKLLGGKFGALGSGGELRKFKHGSNAITEGFDRALVKANKGSKKAAADKGWPTAVLGLPKLADVVGKRFLPAFGEKLDSGESLVATSLRFGTDYGVGCYVPDGVGCLQYQATAAVAPAKKEDSIAPKIDRFAAELRSHYRHETEVEVNGNYVMVTAANDKGIEELDFDGFSIPVKLDESLPEIVSLEAGILDAQGKFRSLEKPAAAAELMNYYTQLKNAKAVSEAAERGAQYINSGYASLSKHDIISDSYGKVKYVKKVVYRVDNSDNLSDLGKAAKQICDRLGDSVTATPTLDGKGIKFAGKVTEADVSDLKVVRGVDATPLTLSNVEFGYFGLDGIQRTLSAGSKSLNALLKKQFLGYQKMKAIEAVKGNASYAVYVVPIVSKEDFNKVAALFDQPLADKKIWVTGFTLSGGEVAGSSYDEKTKPEAKEVFPYGDALEFASKLSEILYSTGAKVNTSGGGVVSVNFSTPVRAIDLEGKTIVAGVEKSLSVIHGIKTGTFNSMGEFKAFPDEVNTIAAELAHFSDRETTRKAKNAAVAAGSSVYSKPSFGGLSDAVVKAADVAGINGVDAASVGILGGVSCSGPLCKAD